MGWVLGLDVGDVRVGAALAHTDARVALPHRTFQRAKGEAERAVIELVAERNIELIVVGLPLSADGSESEQCAKIKNFCRRLTKRVNVKVVFTDEYSSSLEAREAVQAAGRSRSAEEGGIDSIAAAIILNSYFESGS